MAACWSLTFHCREMWASKATLRILVSSTHLKLSDIFLVRINRIVNWSCKLSLSLFHHPSLFPSLALFPLLYLPPLLRASPLSSSLSPFLFLSSLHAHRHLSLPCLSSPSLSLPLCSWFSDSVAVSTMMVLLDFPTLLQTTFDCKSIVGPQLGCFIDFGIHVGRLLK